MESRIIEVDGIPMRWEETGEGDPVILLHGIPTSPRLWRHVVPSLRGVRALAWEMVGYGASIPHGRGRDISVGRQVDYLVRWMQVLGIERAVLVGHDLGGGVAQIAAARHPDRVSGLVLIDSIAYDSWPIPSVRLLRVVGPVLAFLPDGVFRFLIQRLIRKGHDSAACAFESMEEHWPYYAAGDAGDALVRQVRSLDPRDTMVVARRLRGLRVPARIVWGADDPFQDPAYGELLARHLDAPLVRVEGGRHFLPEDHSERVAAVINELLGRAVHRAAA